MDAAEEAVLLEDQDRRCGISRSSPKATPCRRAFWLRIALASVNCGQQHQTSMQERPIGNHRRPARVAGTAE